MTTQLPSICFACSRLWPTPDPATNTQLIAFCDAFPKGIPGPIAIGDFDHRKPFGGEKDDLLFKQAPGEAAQVKLDTWEKYHEMAGQEGD